MAIFNSYVKLPEGNPFSAVESQLRAPWVALLATGQVGCLRLRPTRTGDETVGPIGMGQVIGYLPENQWEKLQEDDLEMVGCSCYHMLSMSK